METVKKLTVVMYHYVRDLQHARYPAIKGLDVELFKEQIGFLKRHYHFVSVDQVIDAFAGHSSLPEHPVLLTFDDAYIDHFVNVFPILKRNGIAGAFYPPVKAVMDHVVLDVNKIHFILAVTEKMNAMPKLLNEIARALDAHRDEYGLASFETYYQTLAVAGRFDTADVIFVKRILQVALEEDVRKRIVDDLFRKFVSEDEGAFSRELYMSMDQLQCMVDSGMHVGSHGYDHYWLGSLSKEKQRFEIQKSIEFIAAVGGDVNNWSICYPYGNYNEDTIALCKENGCKLGLTTVVDLADLQNSGGDAIYKIPRLDTNDLPKDAGAIVNRWY